MAQSYDPKYDGDTVTLGYLKKILGDGVLNVSSNNRKVINLCHNYGSTPIPPYKIGDTWTTADKVYKCIKERKMGVFNKNDWIEIYNKKTNEIISKASTIIIENKILTDLQFFSFGKYYGYDFLGFKKYTQNNEEIYDYKDIVVDVILPKNFTLVSAYLTIFHASVIRNENNAQTDINDVFYGYSRDIKLYKLKGNKNFKFYADLDNSVIKIENIDLIEISNAFDEECYTPENISNNIIDSKNTIDIKSYFSDESKNSFVLRTTSDIPSDDITLMQKTGLIKAIVTVSGYVKEG